MAAVGLSLIVISFVNLLIGAVALLPSNPVMFRRDCIPLSAALLFIGASALVFTLIA